MACVGVFLCGPGLRSTIGNRSDFYDSDVVCFVCDVWESGFDYSLTCVDFKSIS